MSDALEKDQAPRWRSVCPVASGLDVLGDRWSLLIIRDLLVQGPRTYSQFREADEGISTNILASRLKLLTALGLIERVDPGASTRNNAYRLTTAGAALQPVLESLARWTHDHLAGLNPGMVSLEEVVASRSR